MYSTIEQVHGPEVNGMRTVLFYRNYRKFHGGHLKLWDYFSHVLASPEFTPRIEFSPRSNWDLTNPWWNARDYILGSARSVHPDVFFVEGRDWLMMDEHPEAGIDIPVVNLVQHVRHADPKSNRFQFLSRKAIRICVSEEVAQALKETGITRGPLIVIPNGLDLESLPVSNGAKRDVDVLIAALKQPELGEELERRLKRPGRRIEVLSERLPRPEYLSLIQRARTTVFLPNETEGFYLPALEGMALGTVVVCPDCVGNRSFCFPEHNAFRPNFTVEAMVQAAQSALALEPDQARQIVAKARQTAEAHSLLRERRAFLEVLHNIDQLWGGALDGERREDQAERGRRTKVHGAVQADEPLPGPIVVCDEPTNGSEVARGTVVNGWVFSSADMLDVSLWLDGQRVGQAEQGFERPAVAADHPEWPGALRSGYRYRFDFIPEVASAESSELVIVAVDAEGRRTEVRRVVRVDESLFGPVLEGEVPEEGSDVRDGTVVSGWAFFNARDEVTALWEEKQTMRRRSERLRQKLEKVAEQTKTLRQENKRLRQKVKELTQQTKTIRQENRRLRQKVEREKQQAKSMRLEDQRVLNEKHD